MGEYCKQFGLKPSETPQVVATTTWPGAGRIGNRVIVNMSGDADSGAEALRLLADQLASGRLDQSKLDSSDWWNKVGAAGRATLSAVGCYLNKVSLSIKTGVLNLELTHSRTDPC
jgi:hypothetical protein